MIIHGKHQYEFKNVSSRDECVLVWHAYVDKLEALAFRRAAQELTRSQGPQVRGRRFASAATRQVLSETKFIEDNPLPVVIASQCELLKEVRQHKGASHIEGLETIASVREQAEWSLQHLSGIGVGPSDSSHRETSYMA